MPLPVPFVVGGTVNAYVLPGPPHVLVDPGPATPAAQAQLAGGLTQLGLALADVDVVLITHSHVDHAGAAAALARAAGATVAGHPAARTVLTDWASAWAGRLAHFERAARAGGCPGNVIQAFLVQGAERADYGRGDPAAAFRALADGDVIVAGQRRWRVLHTPGHAADHVALYQAETALLIGGDLLLRHVPTVAFLDPRRSGSRRGPALAELVQAWRTIGRLSVATLWPGHGAPIRAHRILVARRLAGTRARLRAARNAVADGATTVWEVAVALGLSSSPTALAATLSEAAGLLEWLTDRGLLDRSVVDGVVRYVGSARS